MTLKRDRAIVPALMFHSVGLENHRWIWNHISEPVTLFESKIALLSRAGYHAITWAELYDHMSGIRQVPPDSILLTFDDGYLDNWVYVYPILKKYGMKGTIFVNPDFMDPGSAVRANQEDVDAGRCSAEELHVAGFLNAEELSAMQSSGVMDIQSHAMTHTWYPVSPHVVDYHRPTDVSPYPWLFWNARPDRKPYYLNEDQQEFLPYGTPVFEHDKALVAKRFFPDNDAVSDIVQFTQASGGAEFFVSREKWREELDGFIAERFGSKGIPGGYESHDERLERVRFELTESKRLLETLLHKPVEYICWPGGGNDSLVRELATQVGYKSWTLGSRDRSDKRNRPGADPGSIKRMGSLNQFWVKGRGPFECGADFQLRQIRSHQGSTVQSLMTRAYKAYRLMTG